MPRRRFALALAALSVASLPSVLLGEPAESYLVRAPFKMAPIPLPTFPDRRFPITDYGAVGDGQMLNTGAFAAAIEACARAGGGHVIVPPGLWLTAGIQLRSQVDLHLERGALVQFTPEHAAYPLVARGPSFGVNPQLSGTGLQNVAVTGEGIIDGAGDSWRPVKRYKMTDPQWQALLAKGGTVSGSGHDAIWWPTREAMLGEDLLHELASRPAPPTLAEALPARDYLRPILFSLSGCDTVLVEDVTLRNSPMFACFLSRCTNVTVRRATVENEWWAQNSDALDLSSCHRVLLYRCTINAGDDGLCMKSEGAPPPDGEAALRDIVIAECTVYHAHGGFVIGGGTSSGMRRIWVTQCDFVGTDSGIYVKSGIGRGGSVRDIFVDHLYMTDLGGDVIVFDPLYVNRPASASKTKAAARVDTARVPDFADFVIRDLYCFGAAGGIILKGLPQQPVQRILIENCVITAAHGVHAENASDITLKHVVIHTPEIPVVTEKNTAHFRVMN